MSLEFIHYGGDGDNQSRCGKIKMVERAGRTICDVFVEEPLAIPECENCGAVFCLIDDETAVHIDEVLNRITKQEGKVWPLKDPWRIVYIEPLHIVRPK